MKIEIGVRLVMIGVTAWLLNACATPAGPAAVTVVPPTESKIVDISIVVEPRHAEAIPEGSRIVIADIVGDCADEVKAALMRRLIDNSQYDVLARDNLDQIIRENYQSWEGDFNSNTAAKLGDLLGASLFVVGQVVYCGQSAGESLDNEFEAQFNVMATLQIIDLQTGKVLVSSSSEGSYVPRPTLLFADDQPAPGSIPRDQETSYGDRESEADSLDDAAENSAHQDWLRRAAQGIGRTVGQIGSVAAVQTATGTDPSQPQEPNKKKKGKNVADPKPEPETYSIIKAAEAMANGFADKFFARPMWERVAMWQNPQWSYSDSIRYVKLGQCPNAVEIMARIGVDEKRYMGEKDLSEFLHNYGVALLCANKPEKAMTKLRSAYRLNPSPETIEMLGLAGKIIEWSLEVEVDQEPEVQRYIQRISGKDGFSSSEASPP